LSQLASLRPSVAGLKRLGPRAGQVLEALLRTGGKLRKGTLAEAVGMRTGNLTRRGGVLQWLVDAEIVEREGHLVTLLPSWPEALEAARRRGAEVEASELQRTRHALQRARWAHGSNPPKRHSPKGSRQGRVGALGGTASLPQRSGRCCFAAKGRGGCGVSGWVPLACRCIRASAARRELVACIIPPPSPAAAPHLPTGGLPCSHEHLGKPASGLRLLRSTV